MMTPIKADDAKIGYFFAALDCELYNGVAPDKALRRAVESYKSVFREELRPRPDKPAPQVLPDPWVRGREPEAVGFPTGLAFFLVTLFLSIVTFVLYMVFGACQ